MRLKYVYLLAGPAPGVEQKIRDQARSLRTLGVEDMEIVAIGPTTNLDVAPARLVCRPRRSPRDHVDYALRRFRILGRVLRHEQADVVLLRYPLSDPHAPRLASEHFIVSEHHTKELEERSALTRSGLGPLQRAHKTVSLARERRYAPRYLSRCKGIVAVSDEIRRYELARTETDKPSITVPNGIAVERVPHTRFRPFDGRALDIVALTGRDSPWHGTDRLRKSLSTYRGRVRITLHIVGQARPRRSADDAGGNVDTVWHGRLVGADLDDLMRRMNLAASSLSLHRIGLHEVSPLKTREFVSRGIPFVIAYRDPDLPESGDDVTFVLGASNDDTLVSVESIIDFAERMTSRERDHSVSDAMRAYAREHLDWSKKMQRLVSFLREIA